MNFCECSSKLFHLSLPWFPHLKNGTNNGPYPIGRLRDRNSLTHPKSLEHCMAHGSLLMSLLAPWLLALINTDQENDCITPGKLQRPLCRRKDWGVGERKTELRREKTGKREERQQTVFWEGVWSSLDGKREAGNKGNYNTVWNERDWFC